MQSSSTYFSEIGKAKKLLISVRRYFNPRMYDIKHMHMCTFCVHIYTQKIARHIEILVSCKKYAQENNPRK
jgi:hypothetical protein